MESNDSGAGAGRVSRLGYTLTQEEHQPGIKRELANQRQFTKTVFGGNQSNTELTRGQPLSAGPSVF
jgi:hypothetical protein